MKLDFPLTPFIKIDSKLIEDLNTRSETVVRNNLKKKKQLFNNGLSKFFLDTVLGAQATEAKVNKYDCIKLKNFWTVKVKKINKM